ncbi:MAG: ATP-binding protein [Ghiorsea sp.]|nr:ATP-binding protein [Ghiorsea sp.]
MHYVGVEFAILVVAAGLIYWLLSVQIYQEVDEDLFRDAQQLVQQLEKSPTSQWSHHLREFSTYYRGVVQLVNHDGVVLFSVGEELVGHEKHDISHAIHGAFEGNATIFVSTRSLLREDNLRVAVMPIRAGTQIIAVAILARTTRDIQKFFKLLYVLGGILGLLSMLISGLVGYRMARRSLRPLNDITDAAHAVAYGDLSRRLNSSVHDQEIRDLIHSLNKMFECLETNFNSQKRFVSDTSHVLRHPITILKSEIEVALMQERSPEEYKALLKHLFSITERMQHIVNDMLTLAQADAGTLEIPQEHIDLSLMLQEVGQDHLMLFAKRHIHFEMDIQDDLEVMGDQRRLERVFYNLLNNASRYAPDHSTVTLQARAEEQEVIIKVSDQGSGVPLEAQPHLFERFFRADDARNNQKGEGAGLGLAICKHIVLAHQGTIFVQSEPERGATFEVKLPLSSVNPDYSKRLQNVLQDTL